MKIIFMLISSDLAPETRTEDWTRGRKILNLLTSLVATLLLDGSRLQLLFYFQYCGRL